MTSGFSSTSQILSDAERVAWLRLIRTDHVGPVTFRKLLEELGSASAALAALPELSRRGGRRKPLRPASKALAVRELETVARFGGRTLAACEPDYPLALASLEDAPPILHLKGHAHLLAETKIAMVGARHASQAGLTLAHHLARALGQSGLVVVSGLARGVDGAVHQGALETGTLAVLGAGIDMVYPEENRELHQAIAERGLLVSEYPPGAQPQARFFPQRNRVIAGLSLGVIVVEAAQRSGSLITARYALDYGREVFAVPGSPLEPRSQGPNLLIRDGATLVQSADDVLEVLEPLRQKPLAQGDLFFSAPPPSRHSAPQPGGTRPQIDETALATARRTVIELLSPTAVPVDEILRQCQLSPSVVQTVLLELELAGRLERHQGGRIALCPDP